MYAAAVICVIFTAVSASQIPLTIPRVPWGIEEQSGQPEPERCCSASAYTYEADSVVVSVKDGSLLTEYVHQRGAYDSVEKMITIEEVLGFSNGAEDTIKLISDYQNEIAYRITTQHGTTECEKMKITHHFGYNCLPEGSRFVNWETKGDRDIRAANWYMLWTDHPTEDVHVIYTFKQPECVDLGYVSVGKDKATGAVLWADFLTRSNYNLGICDPDKWFKPPAVCQGAKLLKTTPKQRFGRLGPKGKRPMFL